METLTVRLTDTTLARGAAHDVHTAMWRATQPTNPAAHPVVLAHGLGGSHVNWTLLGPRLAVLAETSDQVWAPDLGGFGLTSPYDVNGVDRGAGLEANADLLVGFIRTVAAGRPVTLMGNSMGGLLSLKVAARHPELVANLVLINPAVPAPFTSGLDLQVASNFALMSVPRLGERVLALRQGRLTPQAQVAQTLALCAADPEALDPQLLRDHTELVITRRGFAHAHRAFLQAARDIVRQHTRGRRALWEDVARISAPTLYLQGALDRLVRPVAGDLLRSHRPDWTHVRYDDLGHVPMMEDAARVAADLQQWLAVDEQDAQRV